ncbi:MAG: hypothetical protein AAF799_48350 [Myxococcota bacterium]
MTLPKDKSRGITVDAERYRWLVRRIGPGGWDLRLLVEHAAGQGQRLVLAFEGVHGTDSIPRITPRYVAALIHHAQAQGWQPQSSGRDLELQPSTLRGIEPERGAPVQPPTGSLLSSVLEFLPLRTSMPWLHHDPGLFVRFRICAEVSDKLLGTMFAHLVEDAEVRSKSLPAALEGLAGITIDGDDPPFSLEGGIEAWVEGRSVIGYGCCAEPHEWIQWRDLLEDGSPPWNGHDPFTTARLEGGKVLFVDPDSPDEPASVSLGQYRLMLRRLEEDRLGFVRRVEAWVGRHAPASVTVAVCERVAASIGIPYSDNIRSS